MASQPAEPVQVQAPEQAAQVSAPETVAQPVQPEASTSAFGATPGLDDAGSTNNLLQLARRLHEEHVREGIEKRDALIAEGQATAARLVSEAEAEQGKKVAELEQQRSVLEAQIEELRSFERDYRTNLKGYIEGQLRELDSADTVTSGSTGVSAGGEGFGSDYGVPANQPPANFQGFGGN